ncbi:MAG: hypothetical protein ABIC57_01960 [bacterium]
MPTYVAEAVPVFSIYEALDKYWEEYSGSIPKPRLFDIGRDGRTIRVNMEDFLQTGHHDIIVMRPGTPTLEENPIGNWIYGNRTGQVVLEMYTKHSRQRLYDMVRETRRIMHLRMHSVEGYQRVQFKSFVELTDEPFSIHIARVTLELVNNAVLLETT